MHPIWTVEVELIKYQRRQYFALDAIFHLGRVGQSFQDGSLFLIRVGCAHFDGNILCQSLVAGKPDRGESAITKLMDDAVLSLEMVADSDRMVSSGSISV